MSEETVGTGLRSLDALLGGLIAGDNVVWVGDRVAAYEAVEAAFLAAVAGRHPTAVVATTGAELRRPVPAGVERVDAAPGSRLARPLALADELERRMQEPLTCFVIDGLATLADRWGADEALRFFARMCPAMLQAGAVTYWRIPRALGAGFLDRVRQITQVFLELRDDQLHVVKAESRDQAVQGSVHRLQVVGDAVTLTTQVAAGRLARGLAAVRRDLGLTQAQLAEAAGITASAVSQAENGQRGLSVDTLITLSDRLGVTLDRLVSTRPAPGYRLARHDRSRALRPGIVSLADDARSGLRAYLVTLGGDEEGTAPAHTGVALVAVLRGLVQVEVGHDTPVLRAGDSLLATSAAVAHWRNLRPDPAAFYWILRD